MNKICCKKPMKLVAGILGDGPDSIGLLRFLLDNPPMGNTEC